MSRSLMRRTCAVMMVLPLLAACSNDPHKPGILADTKSIFNVTRAAGKSTPAAPVQLTPALIAAAAPVPLIALTVENDGRSTVLARMASNGGVDTFSTADKITVSTRDGIVVATRGLGYDLMSVNAPSASQIARGQGQHRRSYQTLDALDQIQNEIYNCALSATGSETVNVAGYSVPTRRVSERCEGGNALIENEYFVDGAGRIRDSRQWIGPGGGFLRIKRP